MVLPVTVVHLSYSRVENSVDPDQLASQNIVYHQTGDSHVVLHETKNNNYGLT